MRKLFLFLFLFTTLVFAQSYQQAPTENDQTNSGKILTGTESPNNKFAKDVAINADLRIQHSMAKIKAEYGDDVVLAPKTLFRFGKNSNVPTSGYASLMQLPSGVLNETYLTTNAIDSFSSSNAGDTGPIFVSGHTVDGSGNYTRVEQVVTLTGQTRGVLTTPLARVDLFYNVSTADFLGDIYIYENTAIVAGVPTDGTKVHIMSAIAEQANQGLKAATTISSNEYYILTEAFTAVNEKAGAASVNVRIEARQGNNAFITVGSASVSTSGSTWVSVDFNPPLIIPKNADMRVRAKSSSNNTDVAGSFNGYLATIKE